MSQNYIKLYSPSSSPDKAYFLNEGKVLFYITDVDKYSINGKNLIIGATELIMNQYFDTKTNRIETAITDRNSKLKLMPVEKFFGGMKSFSFLLNVSIVLAKQVHLTNFIIHKNINELTGEQNKERELLVEYYKIVNRIEEEFENKKFPWLNDLSKKFITTLIYKRGEALYRSSEPTKITLSQDMSDKTIEYTRDSVIVEENTKGEEMFILESGSIDVHVGGNKVATINDVGTVFGEMALLLGEMRTATLKAKNNVVLTRITKEDLKREESVEDNILHNVSLCLAKKHYYNIIRIESTNKSLAEKHINEEIDPKEKRPAQLMRIQMDLRGLKEKVEDVINDKKADFLMDLLKTF